MPERSEIPPLSAGATVIRIATAIGVRETETREEAGLTAAELRALQCSRDAPGMGALGEALGAPKSTITSVVDQLVDRGLVSRRADERDRRRQIVALTKRGHEVLAEHDTALAARIERLVAALTAAQRTRLTELLARLPTP